MKLFKKFEKKHREWILKYAIVVVIMLVVFFAGQTISNSILRKETVLANSNVVKQMAVLCDNYISEMQGAANRLIVNSDVRSIYKQYPSTPAETANFVKNIISQQESIVNANRIIKNSAVIFRDTDMCITHETMCTKDIFYHMMFEDYYPSSKDCLQDIFIEKSFDFKYLEDKKSNGKIFYIYSFIYDSADYDSNPVVVVFELDLQSAVGVSAKNEIGDYFIMTDKKEIAYMTQIPDEINLKDITVDNFDFDSHGFNVNSKHSRIAPFRYYHLIKKSAYLKSVNTVNAIMVICGVLCLIIGLIMAFVFGRRDYLLVSRMIDKIYDDEKTFRVQQSKMKEFYFSNYLSGNNSIKSEDIKSEFSNMVYDRYALILIDITDLGIYKENEYDMACYCIQNVFNDVTNGTGINTYCTQDRAFICLTNFESSPDEKEKIISQIDYTAEFLNMHFGIEFKRYVTPVTDDIEKIRLLYTEGLNELFESTDKSSEEDKNRMDERIETICRYVDENYSDGNLSVQAIADNFGLSFNYISKYFKENHGLGLAKYIILKRMEEAKKLLVSTNYSIAKIASETGFFSSNVFIRSFKKVEGITPGQYRKNNTQ